MAQKTASNRSYVVTPLDNGDTLMIGGAGTDRVESFFTVQFQPSTDFAGSFLVLGRLNSAAAVAANVQFLPIQYRRVNVAGAASDYSYVADPVIPAGIIRIPTGGLSIGLLTTCTAGSCSVVSIDLQGSSAI